MNLKTNKEEDFLLIMIDGDLDASSSIMLDNTLSDAFANNEKKVLVDCADLNYISSAGLGVFMSYIQDFKTNGIYMALFNMSDKVKNVFEVLGLDQLITIVSTKKDAITSGR